MIYRPTPPTFWQRFWQRFKKKPEFRIIPPFNPTGARMLYANMEETKRGCQPKREGWTDE